MLAKTLLLFALVTLGPAVRSSPSPGQPQASSPSPEIPPGSLPQDTTAARRLAVRDFTVPESLVTCPGSDLRSARRLLGIAFAVTTTPRQRAAVVRSLHAQVLETRGRDSLSVIVLLPPAVDCEHRSRLIRRLVARRDVIDAGPIEILPRS